jgi:hypothetical protein
LNNEQTTSYLHTLIPDFIGRRDDGKLAPVHPTEAVRDLMPLNILKHHLGRTKIYSLRLQYYDFPFSPFSQEPSGESIQRLFHQLSAK